MRDSRSRKARILSLAACALLAGAAVAAPKGLDADEILRRAEAVRSPDLGYCAELTIRAAWSAEMPERVTSYSMVAGGKDRTWILMRSPEAFYGGLLLIEDGRYWMLLPKASKPFELSGAQLVSGDVSSGVVARVNLARGYTARLVGEEPVEGEDCYRLELLPSPSAAMYSRVDYWIVKKKFLPRRLDYYGRTGNVLKTVWYREYLRGALGLRPARLEIKSQSAGEGRSVLLFSDLRRVSLAGMPFSMNEMTDFRDAVLAGHRPGKAQVRIEEILAALKSKAPARPGR